MCTSTTTYNAAVCVLLPPIQCSRKCTSTSKYNAASKCTSTTKYNAVSKCTSTANTMQQKVYFYHQVQCSSMCTSTTKYNAASKCTSTTKYNAAVSVLLLPSTMQQYKYVLPCASERDCTSKTMCRWQDMERRGSKSSILGTLGFDGPPASFHRRRASFQTLGESVVWTFSSL